MSSIAKITLQELEQYLRTSSTRAINEVVLHHTWSPTASQWRGQSTWDAIRRYHMTVPVPPWSDIGYHFGVGPDGSLWRLRPVNQSGAHVLNRNARTIGVAMIGNYDTGADDPRAVLPGAADIVAACCKRHGLGVSAVRFHREFQNKSCPGTGLELAAFRTMVEARLRGVPDAQSEILVIEGLGPQPDKVIRANARLEAGVLRADLRALLEGLGYVVHAHLLGEQGKVYVERLPE